MGSIHQLKPIFVLVVVPMCKNFMFWEQWYIICPVTPTIYVGLPKSMMKPSNLFIWVMPGECLASYCIWDWWYRCSAISNIFPEGICVHFYLFFLFPAPCHHTTNIGVLWSYSYILFYCCESNFPMATFGHGNIWHVDVEIQQYGMDDGSWLLVHTQHTQHIIWVWGGWLGGILVYRTCPLS